MKVIEENGHKYSAELFDEYKIRVMVEASRAGSSGKFTMTIYTTNENKGDVMGFLVGRTKPDIYGISIFHWATREQDDMDSLFIDDVLKGF